MGINVKTPEGLGDTVMSTRVLKALRKEFPKDTIRVFVNPQDKQADPKEELLKGVCKKYDIEVVREQCSEGKVIDLVKYQYFLPNIRKIHYSDAMLECAEDELLRKFNRCAVLDRGQAVEICLSDEELATGKEVVEELQKKSGKPLLWLHTHARKRGGTNRTPREEWWKDLIRILKAKFTLFEILRSDEEAVDKELLKEINDMLQDTLSHKSWKSIADIPLLIKAAIIKCSVGGIAIDSVAKDLAAAVGNFRVALILGSTHPKAAMYPGFQVAHDFVEGKDCYGCGNHGYIPPDRIAYAEEVMAYRSGILNFKFDDTTGCRSGAVAEGKLYECLTKINPKKVAAMATEFLASFER